MAEDSEAVQGEEVRHRSKRQNKKLLKKAVKKLFDRKDPLFLDLVDRLLKEKAESNDQTN